MVNEYEQAKTNSDKSLERILSKMRKNLLDRTNNEYYPLYKKHVSIKEASFEQLLQINGELNKIETSKTMESSSDLLRQEQLKNNKFNPENSYPQKTNFDC